MYTRNNNNTFFTGLSNMRGTNLCLIEIRPLWSLILTYVLNAMETNTRQVRT